ncbi:MAG: hypothetical protein MUD17_08405 [Gemmatimonadaceae bacterium]|nr:hypothetical protein [Gemmatimonadaceae bacterium]
MPRSTTGARAPLLVGALLSATSPTVSAQPPARVTGTAELTAVALPPLIGAPSHFVGQGDRLILVDYSDMSVHWADAEGRWLGALRRVGGGPGELREIAGVQFAPEGQVWISDGANSRVSVRNRRDLSVIDEFRVDEPLRSVVPARGGASLLAVPNGVQQMAVVIARTGSQRRAVAFSPALASINPIARERYHVRISDSLSVLQLRWLDVRVGLAMSGDLRYTAIGDPTPPEIVAMKLDDRGSVGYRIATEQKEFAVAAAATGDTLLVIRGSQDPRDHERLIARYDARTGRLIDYVRLARSVQRIAATAAGVFVIGETDDGFAMYRVGFPRR